MKEIKVYLIRDYRDVKVGESNGLTTKTEDGKIHVALFNEKTRDITLTHELIHVLQFAGEFDFIADCFQEIIESVPELFEEVYDTLFELYPDTKSLTFQLELQAYLITEHIVNTCKYIYDDGTTPLECLLYSLVENYQIKLTPVKSSLTLDELNI